jgi:hypothetical protein
VSEKLVKELNAAVGVTAWKDGRYSVRWKLPDEPSGVESFDRPVPLSERIGELKVQLEAVSAPGVIVLEAVGKSRCIWDGHKGQIRKAKSVRAKGFSVRLNSGSPLLAVGMTDAPQRPVVMKLERIAIADGNSTLLVDSSRLLTAGAIERRPELGCFLGFFSPVGSLRRFDGGRLIYDRGRVTVSPDPGGLTGGARAVYDNDHAASRGAR